MFLLWDWTWIILLPAVALGLYAQARVSAAFSKWSKIRARRGITGAEAAAFLLRAAGIDDVRIQATRGFLSDHYGYRCGRRKAQSCSLRLYPR